jgi:hypothetical protein
MAAHVNSPIAGGSLDLGANHQSQDGPLVTQDFVGESVQSNATFSNEAYENVIGP